QRHRGEQRAATPRLRDQRAHQRGGARERGAAEREQSQERAPARRRRAHEDQEQRDRDELDRDEEQQVEQELAERDGRGRGHHAQQRQRVPLDLADERVSERGERGEQQNDPEQGREHVRAIRQAPDREAHGRERGDREQQRGAEREA